MTSDNNADARSAERERVRAILTSEEGQARPTLARQLALDTEMTPDQAAATLQAAAPEPTARPAGETALFASLAEAAAVPDVGPDAADEGREPRSRERGAADAINHFNNPRGQ